MTARQSPAGVSGGEPLTPAGCIEGCVTARRLATRLVGEGDCLVFTGARDVKGYGRIGFKGRVVLAHRLAWEMVNGPIPDGLVVMHICDNPPCCYVDHLSLGTVGENNADRHAKGRTVMPTNGPDYMRERTHCPQGHPYAGDNVRYRPDGARRCATCSRARASAWAASNRDRINARRRHNAIKENAR